MGQGLDVHRVTFYSLSQGPLLSSKAVKRKSRNLLDFTGSETKAESRAAQGPRSGVAEPSLETGVLSQNHMPFPFW